MDNVSSVSLESDLIGEFTSANKVTSKEQQVRLSFNLSSGEKLIIFSFLNDYQEPSDEIKLIFNALDGLVRNSAVQENDKKLLYFKL